MALLCEDSNDFFYAEFDGLNKKSCSPWIRENVFKQASISDTKAFVKLTGNSVSVKNKKPGNSN